MSRRWLLGCSLPFGMLVHLGLAVRELCAAAPVRCGISQDLGLRVGGSLVALVLLLAWWEARRMRLAPRWRQCLLGALVVCGMVSWPRPLAATGVGCGPTTPRNCLDQQIVQLQVGVQEFFWTVINRPLLQLARIIESVRVWMMDDVFGTAFDATVAGIQFPFWLVAGIAWAVFVVCFFLQALIDLRLVDLRRGILYLGLAMFLFQVGSQALAATERMRVQVGSGLGQIALTSGSTATRTLSFFASNDDSLRDPTSIYHPDGGAPCPAFPTARATPSMMMSDYAATFLAANAIDIHCPSDILDPNENIIPMPLLPFAYGESGGVYSPTAGFAWQFANPSQIYSDDLSSETLQQLLQQTRAGVVRQSQGVILCVVAVLEQVLHLLFALALGIVWLGLLLSLLVVLFLPTEQLFTMHLRNILQVLQSSWKASMLLAVLLSLMFAAAEQGNAGVLFGVALLLLALTWALCLLAGKLVLTMLHDSMAVLGQTPRAVGSVVQGAVKGIGGGMTGMAAGALSGAMAATTTRNPRYGLGVMAGRSKALRTAGQLATATGAVGMGSALMLGMQAAGGSPLDWSTQRRYRAHGARLAAASATPPASSPAVGAPAVRPQPDGGMPLHAEPALAQRPSVLVSRPVLPTDPLPIPPASVDQRASSADAPRALPARLVVADASVRHRPSITRAATPAAITTTPAPALTGQAPAAHRRLVVVPGAPAGRLVRGTRARRLQTSVPETTPVGAPPAHAAAVPPETPPPFPRSGLATSAGAIPPTVALGAADRAVRARARTGTVLRRGGPARGAGPVAGRPFVMPVAPASRRRPAVAPPRRHPLPPLRVPVQPPRVQTAPPVHPPHTPAPPLPLAATPGHRDAVAAPPMPAAAPLQEVQPLVPQADTAPSAPSIAVPLASAESPAVRAPTPHVPHPAGDGPAFVVPSTPAAVPPVAPSVARMPHGTTLDHGSAVAAPVAMATAQGAGARMAPVSPATPRTEAPSRAGTVFRRVARPTRLPRPTLRQPQPQKKGGR